MTHTRTAADYRSDAKRVREIAERSPLPMARDGLGAPATKYEALAAQIDATDVASGLTSERIRIRPALDGARIADVLAASEALSSPHATVAGLPHASLERAWQGFTRTRVFWT